MKVNEKDSLCKNDIRKRLERDFFMTDALELAQKLIGKVLVHETPLGVVRGMITETEAYMGVEDKGSHTYKGKRTKRTEPMFHIGGTSYVYLIYGMYSCVNITAGDVDVPMAVLIRRVEPYDEESRKIMESLRGMEKADRHLADGPGKLCIAMHISKDDNDIDLVTDDKFYLTEGVIVKKEQIMPGKRIGIDYAQEAADYLWRYTLI